MNIRALRDVYQFGLMIFLLVIVAEIATAIGFSREYTYSIISRISIMMLFAIAFNIAFGYGGILSFGHALLFGGGGYILAILSVKLGLSNIVVTLPAAAAAGGILGLFLGGVSMRNVGMAVVLITFAIAHSCWLIIQLNPWGLTNGEGGISGIDRIIKLGDLKWTFDGAAEFYWIVGGICILGVLVASMFVRGRFGTILRATRDEPIRSEALGYSVKKIRVLAFALSGVLTGLAGGLMVLLDGVATPEDAHWLVSGDVLLYAVLGGAGIFIGPAIGAAIVVTASIYLSELINSWPLILGMLYIVIIRFAPGGVLQKASKFTRRLRSAM